MAEPRPYRRYSKLPAVPTHLDPQLRAYLQSMKNILELMMQDRNRIDARPTIRQLEDASVPNAEDIL